MSIPALLSDRMASLEAICRARHVKRLDLFGSAVDVRFDPDTSDFDFLVEFELLPPSDYADAYFGLLDDLSAALSRHVDLVTSSSVENPYFREAIEDSKRQVFPPA